ncbi:MAG: hypothetical protein LBC98_02780 [Prevotellaceae bacterium]|nr:hypothetical protein [Prevotellaceae bacterium]
METLKGIKYINSGGRRYLRIDLDMYKDNELLEDFLDGLEVVARKDEEKLSLDEFNSYIDERLKVNV